MGGSVDSLPFMFLFLETSRSSICAQCLLTDAAPERGRIAKSVQSLDQRSQVSIVSRRNACPAHCFPALIMSSLALQAYLTCPDRNVSARLAKLQLSHDEGSGVSGSLGTPPIPESAGLPSISESARSPSLTSGASGPDSVDSSMVSSVPGSGPLYPSLPIRLEPRQKAHIEKHRSMSNSSGASLYSRQYPDYQLQSKPSANYARRTYPLVNI